MVVMGLGTSRAPDPGTGSTRIWLPRRSVALSKHMSTLSNLPLHLDTAGVSVRAGHEDRGVSRSERLTDRPPGRPWPGNAPRRPDRPGSRRAVPRPGAGP